MKPITFSREETKAIVGDIQDYFREELDQSIGAIPAEMLMQFFAEKMGAYFYRQRGRVAWRRLASFAAE
jgi:uncharacterized protein (DUF2164 family)